MASLATVGTGQDGAGWACSIALAGVLINHLTCIKCGDSNSPFLPYLFNAIFYLAVLVLAVSGTWPVVRVEEV